jgi:hypothetical protein
VVHLGFTAAAVVGVGMALYALTVSRTARRRIGNIEARLAALRVRERALERHFESEGAPVRGLLRGLELESPEELDAAAARVHTLMDALERDKRELAEARRAFPEESDAELVELRARLEKARREPEADDVQAELDRLDDEEPPTQPQLAPRATRHPVEAFAAAERAGAAWAGLPLEELRQRFVPVLPLYLRSLTGGRALHAHRSEEGWLIRTQRGGGDAAFRELGERLQWETAVALRLALLESMSTLRSFPLLLAMDELPLEPESRGALARALKRLASVTQVILIADAPAPWAERGARVHEL